MKTSLTALPFAEAASLWLETRKPYLAESSFSDYQHYIKRLSAFFSEVRLPEIDGELVRSYQQMRMARFAAFLLASLDKHPKNPRYMVRVEVGR